MKGRTLARETALQLLYEYDVTGELGRERVESYAAERSKARETQEYARDLVAGVIAHKQEFDAIFERLAQHWAVSRMPVVDRNILRIGTYELLYAPEVPPKVAINEAIELAKRFGGADSGKFANAILDRVHKERANQTDRTDTKCSHHGEHGEK